MSVSIQLIPITGETLVEVSGISEISGMYLENTDVEISVECIADVDDKKIKLSVTPNSNTIFLPFSFIIQVVNHRIALYQLINGSKLIIVPKGIEEDLSDIPAIKALVQKDGGIWIDGFPKELIREIVGHCTC